jgi:phosphatidylserine/phosphatidylglycerophosphate/cardiolipin synthase-like enzyme
LRAKREVLVVNPYVDQTDLADSLWKTDPKQKQVILVTRKPEDSYDQIKKRKEVFHKNLKERGVQIIYNSRIHAKVIAVDKAVAIVSSMNLQSSSTGGSSWEAGLVTKDDTVVESIVDTIYGLIERPESQ